MEDAEIVLRALIENDEYAGKNVIVLCNDAYTDHTTLMLALSTIFLIKHDESKGGAPSLDMNEFNKMSDKDKLKE